MLKSAGIFMRYTKRALTYEQQLQLVEERGLIIGNRDYALHWLRRIGYFRLSAYFLPFKIANTDCFIKGATFSQVVDLYRFDAYLRLLMMQAIDRVEVAARASVTYHLSHVLGSFGYADAANFTPWVPSPGPSAPATGFDHASFMRSLAAEVERSTEDFVRHYKAKYTLEVHLPIWMATELMTFGVLSKMTEGTKKGLRKLIARDLEFRKANW
jgi:abortive infection bacteriophage resistance protein